MNTQIQVMYTVPVACIVDIETGAICSVHEYDEAIEPTGEFLDLEGNPLDAGATHEKAAALAIADGGEIWPAWERG
jgi:hypothetical protein